jgi:hypothetical protein
MKEAKISWGPGLKGRWWKSTRWKRLRSRWPSVKGKVDEPTHSVTGRPKPEKQGDKSEKQAREVPPGKPVSMHKKDDPNFRSPGRSLKEFN